MKKIIVLLLSGLWSIAIYSQTLVYTNDFEAGPPFAGWDIDNSAINPRTGRYLGKIQNNEIGNQQAVLSLDNMPAHEYITVEFDLLTFMTWDGNGKSYNSLTNDSPVYWDQNCPDIFKVTCEGNIMVHTTFSSHDLEFYRYQSYPGTYPQDSYRAGTGAVETNTLGCKWNLDWYKGKLPDARLIQDAIYHFKLTIPQTASYTDIVFQFFNQDSRYNSTFNTIDEWWGIDNISVVVADQPLGDITIVTPIPITQIVPNSNNNGATIYTWGEAGTFLSLQSATNLSQGNSMDNGVDGGFVNLNSVSFSGYYKYNTSFRSAGLQSIGPESSRPTPTAKFFRAKFSK